MTVSVRARPGDLLKTGVLTLDVTFRPVDEEDATQWYLTQEQAEQLHFLQDGKLVCPTGCELSHDEPLCSFCGATGFVGTNLCQECRGTGRLP